MAARKAGELKSLYTFLDSVRGYVGDRGVSSSVAINRARFRMKTGQYEAAIADLEIAARVTPDDVWVRQQLARARALAGRDETAEEHAPEC